MLFFTRLFFLLTFSALLTACGAVKLTYNNADSLLYYWLDSYVDVTVDQKVRIKNELQTFHEWHRKNQLPVWAELAHSLQASAMVDVTPAQLCSFADQVQSKVLIPTINYLEPQVLWLVTHLSSAQLKAIADKYKKTNDKWLEEWQPKTKAELIKNTEKSIYERTDSLYGSLNESQRKWLQETISHSPFDAKLAYTERLRKQQDMLVTLKDIQVRKLSSDAAREPMRALMQRNITSPDPIAQAYADKMKLHTCDWLAKLHNKTTPEQRRHALSKLKDYERDFKTLQVTK